MLGKVTFDEHVNALEGIGKVIYCIHLQNRNGSLSKIKGHGLILCSVSIFLMQLRVQCA